MSLADELVTVTELDHEADLATQLAGRMLRGPSVPHLVIPDGPIGDPLLLARRARCEICHDAGQATAVYIDTIRATVVLCDPGAHARYYAQIAGATVSPQHQRRPPCPSTAFQHSRATRP